MENEPKIPKIVHFCWFGGKPKSPLVESCITSWAKHLPGFSIKEWNESNYDVYAHPFTARMYKEKKWAFVSDYARLEILSKYGGVYLDTDMEILKDISPLLETSLLLGEEKTGTISAGMIGAIPNHPYIEACRERYTLLDGVPPTIPVLITEVYKTKKQNLQNVKVCPPVAFYPYTQETIGTYGKEPLSTETYGVHLWNYSWGNPILRFANKIPLYHALKKILTHLGIKKVLKKILRLS